MAINMPHCSFENTDAALQECYAYLDDTDTDMWSLSENEQKSATRLFKRMKRMIDDYGYLMESKSETIDTPKFQKVWCSQCGKEFGPGNSGFSHCANHE